MRGSGATPSRSGNGYLIVGQRIDPDDWNLRDGNPIPAKEIVDSVLMAAGNGNVILLTTAAAIAPRRLRLFAIIDALRGKGYRACFRFHLIEKRAPIDAPSFPARAFRSSRRRIYLHAVSMVRFFIGAIFFLGIVMVSGRAGSSACSL